MRYRSISDADFVTWTLQRLLLHGFPAARQRRTKRACRASQAHLGLRALHRASCQAVFRQHKVENAGPEREAANGAWLQSTERCERAFVCLSGPTYHRNTASAGGPYHSQYTMAHFGLSMTPPAVLSASHPLHTMQILRPSFRDWMCCSKNTRTRLLKWRRYGRRA